MYNFNRYTWSCQRQIILELVWSITMMMILTLRLTNNLMILTGKTTSQTLILKIKETIAKLSTDNILAFKKPFFLPFFTLSFLPITFALSSAIVCCDSNVLLFYCYTVQYKYFLGYKFCRFVTILILQIAGIIYSHMTSHLFIFAVIIISCFEGKQRNL